MWSCFPRQGPAGGAGVPPQPAAHGVREGGRSFLLFPPGSNALGILTADVRSPLSDPAGGPDHHRQPGDQGANGGVSSGRGSSLFLVIVLTHVTRSWRRRRRPLNRSQQRLFFFFADLGAERPQRQRLLHRLRGRGAAVGPLHLAAQLRGHADGVGADRLPGLPAPHRADRRQRRWVEGGASEGAIGVVLSVCLRGDEHECLCCNNCNLLVVNVKHSLF